MHISYAATRFAMHHRFAIICCARNGVPCNLTGQQMPCYWDGQVENTRAATASVCPMTYAWQLLHKKVVSPLTATLHCAAY